MIFILSKLIKAVILPPAMIFIGMAVALAALYRKRVRLARLLLLATMILYYLLSIEPTANLLSIHLEQHSIASSSEQTMLPRAIVILGSSAVKQEGIMPFEELSGISWQRLWQGLELYRFYNGKVPIIYSGGSGDPFDPISHEALLAKHHAIAFGIPESQFIIEPSSRDTYESAVAVKKILDTLPSAKETPPLPIALVTSATHMTRAQKTMEKVGLSVTLHPANFTASQFRITPLNLIPSYDSFSNSIRALTEWIGIIAYWLRGRV